MEAQINELQQRLAAKEAEFAQLAAVVQQLVNNQNSENQIDRLTEAISRLSTFTNHTVDPTQRILKEIRHMSTFTGACDISINSFISSTEFYLNSINDPELRRVAIRHVFFEKIQGAAKDVVINIQEPDNWESIKKALQLRYKPDIEPFEIYRRISDLRANTVSDLAVQIQNIKCKKDELCIYYKNTLHVDLSNVDSILVNTLKEINQGILLDKIINMYDIGEMIHVMNSRRFENSCIRPEYRKGKNENISRMFDSDRNKNWKNGYNKNSKDNPNNDRQQTDTSGQYRKKTNGNRQEQDSDYNQYNNPNNNSGQYRNRNHQNNNENHRFTNSEQSRNNNRFSESQNFSNNRNSGQNRFDRAQNRGPNRQEPMEIDNVQRNQSRKSSRDFSQNSDNINYNNPISDEIVQDQPEINNTNEEVMFFHN
ncbi:bromodomain-containing protein DDB_G0280777-like [Hermetia illucens]|uniref:bromodomain-containing protein DDB_G0280777-like n=1 Tax=Hermetia illucens TaxID=343691 RepID=UPI0018CBFD51|nr:bromodomain-containing protein DDB_G0280777-like [Hermetia illucens]